MKERRMSSGAQTERTKAENSGEDFNRSSPLFLFNLFI